MPAAFFTQQYESICIPEVRVFFIFYILALRGASSRRKRSSLHAGKSASQEFLSTQKEKKEEKKAQSLDNLDGNCKINFATIFCSIWLFFPLLCNSLSGVSSVYSSSKQPDLLPKSAITKSIQNDEEETENRYSYVNALSSHPFIVRRSRKNLSQSTHFYNSPIVLGFVAIRWGQGRSSSLLCVFLANIFC